MEARLLPMMGPLIGFKAKVIVAIDTEDKRPLFDIH